MNLQKIPTEIRHKPQYQSRPISISSNPYRLECIKYLSRYATTDQELSKLDQIRLSLSDMFQTYQNESRVLYHLTLTYFQPSDYNHSLRSTNRFFVNLYLKKLLPYLFQSRHYNRQSLRNLQPIAYVFADEHESKPVEQSDPIRLLPKTYAFAARLHHHAILAIHPDTQERFETLLGTNTIRQFSKQVMTSDLREAEPMRVLYATKMLHKYEDFLTFPDRLMTVRHK